MVTGDGLNEATLVQIQISVYRFVPPPFPPKQSWGELSGLFFCLESVIQVCFGGKGGLDFQTGAPPNASVA